MGLTDENSRLKGRISENIISLWAYTGFVIEVLCWRNSLF